MDRPEPAEALARFSLGICRRRKRTEYFRSADCGTIAGDFTDHWLNPKIKAQCNAADPAKAPKRCRRRGVFSNSIVEEGIRPSPTQYGALE